MILVKKIIFFANLILFQNRSDMMFDARLDKKKSF